MVVYPSSKRSAEDRSLLSLIIIYSNRHHAGTYDKATNTGGSSGAGMRYEKEGGDTPDTDADTSIPLYSLVLYN